MKTLLAACKPFILLGFHRSFNATPQDCSFKKDPLEFGRFQGGIPGSGGEITVVVAATLTMTLLHCAHTGQPV